MGTLETIDSGADADDADQPLLLSMGTELSTTTDAANSGKCYTHNRGPHGPILPLKAFCSKHCDYDQGCKAPIARPEGLTQEEIDAGHTHKDTCAQLCTTHGRTDIRMCVNHRESMAWVNNGDPFPTPKDQVTARYGYRYACKTMCKVNEDGLGGCTAGHPSHRCWCDRYCRANPKKGNTVCKVRRQEMTATICKGGMVKTGCKTLETIDSGADADDADQPLL